MPNFKGMKHTEETRQKMRDAKKDKKQTPEQIASLARIHELNRGRPGHPAYARQRNSVKILWEKQSVLIDIMSLQL